MGQRRIGITGGIATGKSTVTAYLHHTYGLPILDADVYAREAVTGEVLAQIGDRYGQGILLADGTLDRRQLGQIIFRSPTERQWLEALIHPYVRDRMMTTAQAYDPQTVVLAIPLLFEAKLEHTVTEIWVVACDPILQKQRLIQRNQLTETEASDRIQSQLPLAVKIARADVVIDNSDSLEHLYDQCDRAYHRFV